MELTLGIKGYAKKEVVKELTALSIGSGGLDVLATAMMIALMEKAARESVEPYLDEGCGTVGIKVDVTHESATPIGLNYWAETELIAIDGRKLTFNVCAYDDKGLIGRGTHERFIINNEKFVNKTYSKLDGKE